MGGRLSGLIGIVFGRVSRTVRVSPPEKCAKSSKQMI